MEGHFNIKLHIDNFNKKISIKVNKSIEDKFVDIIFDFKGLHNGFIYSDLYLKKIMKEKVIENTNKNKKYKTIILKIVRKKGNNNNNNNNRPILNLITTKIKTDDVIKSIDNLEKLNLTELNLPDDESFLKYSKDTIIENYDEYINSEKFKKTFKYLKDNGLNEKTIYKYIKYIHNYLLEKKDLNELKNSIENLLKSKKFNINDYDPRYIDEIIDKHINNNEIDVESGGTAISGPNSCNGNDTNIRCVIKMSEYNPISGGSEFNKIPELFLNKKSLLILRNNDNKCFLYCYIREFLNPITKNRFRITKKDKELANKIINETNLDFENVSISEIDKIEKKLQVNVNVFSCNKNYKNKIPVRKSRTDYDKTLRSTFN